MNYVLILFADDTRTSIIAENPVKAAACLETFALGSNLVGTVQPYKSRITNFSRKLIKQFHPPLFMENHQFMEVESHKHLGVNLSADYTWHKHIKNITDKAWGQIVL